MQDWFFLYYKFVSLNLYGQFKGFIEFKLTGERKTIREGGGCIVLDRVRDDEIAKFVVTPKYIYYYNSHKYPSNRAVNASSMLKV